MTLPLPPALRPPFLDPPQPVTDALFTPLPKHRFMITLMPGDAYMLPARALMLPVMAAGSFQEATGLGGQQDVLPHPEGGVNDRVHQLPGRFTWDRITLKRGVTRT